MKINNIKKIFNSDEEELEYLKLELYSREQDIKKILQEALEITEDALKMTEEDEQK